MVKKKYIVSLTAEEREGLKKLVKTDKATRLQNQPCPNSIESRYRASRRGLDR